ncbi:MAG: PIG-L family deacetylase [Chloroflexota bacterium]|nr:PIG-L family deacetylase [Chloroflexota bacterium]
MPGRVLAIFAHPDDAEFTCGGSIASWADAGATVAYVVCTGGCRGGDELTGTDETVRELRENEQQAAAATLGVSEVTFLRHLDGELDRVQELRYELARIIRRWQPDRVLTWDAWKPYQLHPDHRASGMAAVEAVLAAGNPRASLTPLHEELGPHRASDVYLFGTHDPDVWVDISRTLERKLAAVAAHHSQLSATPDFAQSVRACNRDFGGACGCAYAEAFKALHPFCDT